MGEIVMPRLTDSMEEGVILAWLKADGDEVAVGDELVEIETDKASMVYESDLDGTLEILVPEGETRPIGETIANVGGGTDSGDGAGTNGDSDGRTSPGVPSEPPSAPASIAEKDWTEQAEPAEKARSGGRERVKASPLARRIARDKGIELSSLSGSGPGGRIIKVDVEGAKPAGSRAAAKAGRAPASTEAGADGEPEIVELSRTQSLIAKRMSEAKATIPHFYLRTTVNMDRAIEVRAAFKRVTEDEKPPSLNDFVIKAVALALKTHPRANATFRDDRFEFFPRVNIGIAVATEDALLVPVVRDADRLSLAEIGRESRRLALAVRSGEITPPELSAGTFSISNLGMFGVSGFDAVINPGQAGILAVGEVTTQPVVTDEGIGSAQLMEVTLACDHRILYGADGAEFLATVKQDLEEPGLLA